MVLFGRDELEETGASRRGRRATTERAMIDGHLAGRLAVLTAPFDVELVHFRIEPYWNMRILRCVIEPAAAALVAVFFEFAADHT
jgi:hypothetical protein